MSVPPIGGYTVMGFLIMYFVNLLGPFLFALAVRPANSILWYLCYIICISLLLLSITLWFKNKKPFITAVSIAVIWGYCGGVTLYYAIHFTI
jgi:hypothetical protein